MTNSFYSISDSTNFNFIDNSSFEFDITNSKKYKGAKEEFWSIIENLYERYKKNKK